MKDITLDTLLRAIMLRIDSMQADCRCGNLESEAVKAVIAEEFSKRAKAAVDLVLRKGGSGQ